MQKPWRAREAPIMGRWGYPAHRDFSLWALRGGGAGQPRPIREGAGPLSCAFPCPRSPVPARRTKKCPKVETSTGRTASAPNNQRVPRSQPLGMTAPSTRGCLVAGQASRRRCVLPHRLCLRTRCGSRGLFEQGGDCAILGAVDIEQRMKALVVARFHEVAELVGNNEFQA